MLGALNQDCKSYIKRIFETSLRYVLLYAAGLRDQDAMKLSEAISDARQTMAKVHFFALNCSTLSQRHERKRSTAEVAAVAAAEAAASGRPPKKVQ